MDNYFLVGENLSEVLYLEIYPNKGEKLVWKEKNYVCSDLIINYDSKRVIRELREVK